MWTRSAANKITGTMTVTCTDWNGNEFFKGEFDNLADAEAAGRDAERRMTLSMTSPVDEEISNMSNAELIAALMA